MANYIDLDLATAPTPDSGLCRYKGITVACGPPGLPGGKNVLYRNRGDGTFEDVSEKSGITKASGTYGLGVSTLDFDDDGWTDVYVANDSNPSALYRNNRDGTLHRRGRDRAAAPTARTASRRRAWASASATTTATAPWTSSRPTSRATPPRSTRTPATASARTDLRRRDRHQHALAGLGRRRSWTSTTTAGWTCSSCNGHVYPEVEQLETEAGYKQRKVVYRNLGDGRFEDVTRAAGAARHRRPRPARGSAFGDFDNDGDVDVVDQQRPRRAGPLPDRVGPAATTGSRSSWWARASNRSAIGARVRCSAGGAVQVEEVRGGGSYISQNDLRVHFGLGAAARVDRLEVRWPNGLEEEWRDLAVDRILTPRRRARGGHGRWTRR